MKDRCNRPTCRAPTAGRAFQSSPALKDRCNGAVVVGDNTNRIVSILTGLERPVQPRAAKKRKNFPPGFQSSPALKDRCNGLDNCFGIWYSVVSILTGLERPVQPTAARGGNSASKVSILTGLERPVQLSSLAPSLPPCVFQSSPALKDRCNRVTRTVGPPTGRFQSSPALKDRCNRRPAVLCSTS